MKKIGIKDIPEAVKHWEEMLVAYKDQASRLYIKNTDYLPLQLGWSNQQSVDWIEKELRLLKERLAQSKRRKAK